MRDDLRRWPDRHVRPERADDPNWRWLDLWEQENPSPGGANEQAWRDWWDLRQRMSDRVWVAYCLPQFLVWDWTDEDVAAARKFLARHVCGVCGGADDPGCALGC